MFPPRRAYSRMDEASGQLFYVSQSQINFLIPAEAVSGDARFIVHGSGGSSSEPATFRIQSLAPAIFIGRPFSDVGSFGYYLPPAMTVMRLEPDGSRTLLSYACGGT